jgi:hypothetical protein
MLMEIHRQQGLLYECVFDAHLFFSSYRPIRKSISHHFFLLILFWIIIPAILSATMLRYYSMSASLMPSEFISSSFQSFGNQLPIDRHSTSLESARLKQVGY